MESYKQKTIQSMAFYLTHRYDAIQKMDAIVELKKIWSEVQVSDMVKAYKLAYND